MSMNEPSNEADEEWRRKVLKWPALAELSKLGNKVPQDGREQQLLDFIKNHPDYTNMKNNPKYVLDAIEEFAGQRKLLPNLGSDKGRIVVDVIRQNQSKIVVELGGYVGYSAILFGQQVRESTNGVDSAHVWSLEYDPGFANIASELIAIAGLSQVVTVVVGPADDSLRRLKREGKIDHIDLLLIDHIKDLYESDLRVAMDELSLLRQGAYVVADNILKPGAPEYREYVRSHEGLTSYGARGLMMPGEIEDELEISKVL